MCAVKAVDTEKFYDEDRVCSEIPFRENSAGEENSFISGKTAYFA